MLRLARIPIFLLGLLPLRILHGVAVPLGWLLYWIPWKKHRVIQTNLALCFPELDSFRRARLHRQHLVELLRLTLEAGVIWGWSSNRIERHIVVDESWEKAIAADDSGRGLLIVSSHIGNWEILNLFLSLRLPLVALYRAPESPELDAFISRPRERFGGRMVASGGPALRHLLAQLRAGGAAALAADIQPKRGDGVFVDLFNTPALTMTLVNRLARKTGCRVVYIWAERLTGGRGWKIHVNPADSSITDPDPITALTPMNRWLEAAIKQAPAQYLWIYKRFSRRPEGEQKLYR